jgi:hypothetical protein
MFADIFANAIKLIRPAERHESKFFVVGGEPPCRRKEDHCTTAQVLHAGRWMSFMGCSAAAFLAVAFTAAITISPASAQAADVQAQIDRLGVAP